MEHVAVETGSRTCTGLGPECHMDPGSLGLIWGSDRSGGSSFPLFYYQDHKKFE